MWYVGPVLALVTDVPVVKANRPARSRWWNLLRYAECTHEAMAPSAIGSGVEIQGQVGKPSPRGI